MTTKQTLIRLAFATLVLFAVSLFIQMRVVQNIKTISVQLGELETLLSEMAWVSPALSDDRAVYEISFRTCGPCIRYHKTEFPKLQKMNVDTRLFVFARRGPITPSSERTVIAQLYKNRSWELAQKWYETASPKKFYAKMTHMPIADDNEELTQLVIKGRAQIDRLENILMANDIRFATPTLIWKNKQDKWKISGGYTAAINAKIRKDLAQRN